MEKKHKENIKGNNGEDVTTSGEMIPSYFAWLTLDEQKKRAKELQNIGKKNKQI